MTAPTAKREAIASTTGPIVDRVERTTTSPTARTSAWRSVSTTSIASAPESTSTTATGPSTHTVAAHPAGRAPRTWGASAGATRTATTNENPRTRAGGGAHRTTPTAETRITAWRRSTDPSGSVAPAPAMVSSRSSPNALGRWRSQAPRPPTIPATVPAARPHTINAPATGPARRFAGSAASGMGPSVGTNTGATAHCAPAVTASPSRTQRGPGRRVANRGARTSTPIDAATDSRNPSEWTRSGSTSRRPTTASARWRSPPLGLPVVWANKATTATNAARRTDGSNRVTSANDAITAAASRKRGQSRSARSNGPTTTNTNATFWPESVGTL